jgi:hypothetical protein
MPRPLWRRLLTGEKFRRPSWKKNSQVFATGTLDWIPKTYQTVSGEDFKEGDKVVETTVKVYSSKEIAALPEEA